MPAIESPANPRVKAWLRLRDRRERERTGCSLVDGRRELERALDGGADLVEVVVGPGVGESPAGAALLGRLTTGGTPLVEVSHAVERRLSFGDRAEGFVGVVRIPALELDALRLPPSPLVVVLDRVEKPGNLGAVLRTADGAGVDAVVLSDPVADPYNPNAIRASLGTIFCLPMALATGTEVRGWLAARGVRPVVARVDARRSYAETDLTGAVALVLGSEAQGLDLTWEDEPTVAVRIPMLGVADSLNVSVAAAVLLYEARRQRGAG